MASLLIERDRSKGRYENKNGNDKLKQMKRTEKNKNKQINKFHIRREKQKKNVEKNQPKYEKKLTWNKPNEPIFNFKKEKKILTNRNLGKRPKKREERRGRRPGAEPTGAAASEKDHAQGMQRETRTARHKTYRCAGKREAIRPPGTCVMM